MQIRKTKPGFFGPEGSLKGGEEEVTEIGGVCAWEISKTKMAGSNHAEGREEYHVVNCDCCE